MEIPRGWSDKHSQNREIDLQVFPFLSLTLLQDQRCPNSSFGPIVRPATAKRARNRNCRSLWLPGSLPPPAKHHLLVFTCFKICWLHSSLWWDWQWKLSHSLGASCRENGSLGKIMGFFVLGTAITIHLVPSEKSLMEREVAHVGQ